MKQSKYKEAILIARDAMNQAALIYSKQSEYVITIHMIILLYSYYI